MALPPKLIIQFGKFVWTSMWKIMMSNMAPRSTRGDYIRPDSQFRDVISSPEPGRYKLIVGMGCPWAHRTLIVRALKGLEDVIPVVIVSPSPIEGGWIFDEEQEGCRTLAQFYKSCSPNYTGRSTVPVLWDSQTRKIINNESSEIIVMLNSEFNEFSKYPDLNLYLPELKEKIDSWNEKIYHAVNNGVYRCGFAQTQEAYNLACDELFQVLDEIDAALSNSRYLCGDKVTLADVRLFTTLFRFDSVYYGIFKCNRRRIVDYSNLKGYLSDIYQLGGVADTCDFDSVKRDYYGNLFPLNPGGIIPSGPDISYLCEAHGRESFGYAGSLLK
jgi:glutathionyl-hydroquinone reductase